MKPIYQESMTDCGLACLAMIATHHGSNVTVRQLSERCDVESTAIAAHDLVRIAGSLSLNSRVLRLEPEELPELSTPCILHWKMNHFVVLESVNANKIVIIDPALGRRSITASELDRSFTGIALEITRTENFAAKKTPPAISLSDLSRGLATEIKSLGYIITFAIALEILTLTMPFISQVIIDSAITSQDKDFLLVAVLGGMVLVLFQFTLGVIGNIAKLRLSQRIGLRWSSNLFLHLMKLPWAYFQHRQLGEISSRVSALKPIKEFILASITRTPIDVIVLVCTGSFMALYDTALLWIVLIAGLCYGLTQAIFYPFLRNATAERLILSAKEHAYFLESLRAALTIKMSGNVEHRANQWSNMIVDVQNRDTATQKIQIWSSGINTLIFGIESMSVLFVGGNSIINSEMSIGMLIAFLGFKTNFTSRLSGIIDTVIQWHMNSVQCERLADVVLQKTESPTSNTTQTQSCLQIELVNVSFRHSTASPWIIKDASLIITPGEFLAIVGRSGSGKSTLAKLILGLLEPTEGHILVNGIRLEEFGFSSLRTITGTVMQEDQVLTGTIAENITNFELESCMTQVRIAAKTANLHNVICKFPMGYHTTISNACSTLSSGQRQRLYLARAIYKNPKLLILDEATNNLDLHSEQHIISSLKAMDITLITIAHRIETLALASRIISIENGKVVSRSDN
ncbi:peptidase domain-containing ABC transporter [Pseudomonas sp. AK106]|jgi:ATP-binding cassette subfamily B protein RaxB